jgi:hypothetical protein
MVAGADRSILTKRIEDEMDSRELGWLAWMVEVGFILQQSKSIHLVFFSDLPDRLTYVVAGLTDNPRQTIAYIISFMLRSDDQATFDMQRLTKLINCK